MHIYMCTYSSYAHPVASVKQMCTLMFTMEATANLS